MQQLPVISIERAIYHRPAGQGPRLRARSPGFDDGWAGDIERMLLAFGERPAGVACPGAVFALPLGKEHAAVVQVADLPVESGVPPLAFYLLVLPLAAYREFLGDPFALADGFPPPRSAEGLSTLTLSPQAPRPRSVAEVRQVLQRVKAGALREDEDPEAVEWTVHNAESPALLGGVQVLVDGGKVFFVRPAPDPGLIRGLWTLLPHKTRRGLWPATFAFSNALGFDALVLPRYGDEDFAGYTSEEQAADYPAGHYELSLQTAAESGDQRALDNLFERRSPRDTLRLAVVMAIVLSLAVLIARWPWPQSAPRTPEVPLSPVRRERAANAAALVASGPQPLVNAGWWWLGRQREIERAATAASVVSCGDPLAAAIQLRLAHARHVEIWKPRNEE